MEDDFNDFKTQWIEDYRFWYGERWDDAAPTDEECEEAFRKWFPEKPSIMMFF